MIKKLKNKTQSEPNLKAFLTLFSFSTTARGVQFLIPLIISLIFRPSPEVDSYFYWSTQVNLLAALIASIWPSTLMAIIVKAKTLRGSEAAHELSAYLIRKFSLFSLFTCLVMASLSYCGALGGPDLTKNITFFIQIFLSSVCLSISMAASEVGTASRQFAVVYKSLLFNSIVQIIAIYFLADSKSLFLAFCLGATAQLAATLYLIPQTRDLFRGKISDLHRKNIFELLPAKNTVILLYLGSLLTAVSSHLSYRILDDQIGAVSAFAVASMLALAPQILLIQQISTIAGVSMAECFHKQGQNLTDPSFLRVTNNWRKRLFRSSLLSALAVAYLAFFAIVIFEKNYSQSLQHWRTVAYMCIFLSLPLAVGGLNTWIARLNVSVDKIKAGIYFQIASNILLIIMILAATELNSAYASCVALAINSILQLPAIELFAKYLLKTSK